MISCERWSADRSGNLNPAAAAGSRPHTAAATIGLPGLFEWYAVARDTLTKVSEDRPGADAQTSSRQRTSKGPAEALHVFGGPGDRTAAPDLQFHI